MQEKGERVNGSSKVGEQRPAKSSGKQVKYTRKKLHVKGCIHAFSANKKWKCAFCVRCLALKVEADGDDVGRRYQGRGTRGGDKTQTAEKSNDNDCSRDHRLMMLHDMTEKAYHLKIVLIARWNG